MNDSSPQPTEIRLPACASALAAVEPSREDAAFLVARALRADPRSTRQVVRIASGADGSDASTQLDDALLRAGAPALRALGIALDLCAHGSLTDAQRWQRPLALAFAAREIARESGVSSPVEAFTAGLVARLGHPTLAAWRFPARVVRAVELRASGEKGVDLEEDEATGLVRILDHATLIAEVLCADPARPGVDWARVSCGLEVLREILELDREAFNALLQRAGTEWAAWHAELGLPVPALQTLDDVQRRAGEVPADASVARALQRDNAAPLRGLRILAVDDEPVSLKVLERALRNAGHEVIPAVNGGEALRIALESHPHAVIADWMMPEMDGLDLCRALRRSELGRSVFFLLLTGRGEEDRIVEAFDAGVDDYVTKPFNPKILMARLKGGQRVIELQERVEANRRVVMKQVAEMGLLTRKLRNAAHTDALTELPNRRYAMARLEAEWAASNPPARRSLSVVLIDIDHFKRVNDVHGHDVGDLVLKDVAMVLRANTRQGEEVARLGGEEFFVVCANTDEARARIAAERLRAAVERHVIEGLGFRGGVTISVGVAERSAAMANPDALIKSADQAVYAAKAAGRNRIAAATDPGVVGRTG